MITDAQLSAAMTLGLDQQWRQSILHEEVRSYEVSIWTLQDEFITVLKWSNVEHKGRIQNPKMELSDDGTQKFTFSIPMYYRNELGLLVENPNWYNTTNGNLMINFRKIKVIFNKATDNKKVFDFLITKITEGHENDILTCNIETEGLAFHELGKIGYKYVLSLEEFDLDFQSYQENGYWTHYDGSQKTYEPIQNVQYWCEKVGLIMAPRAGFEDTRDPNKWYYKIQMDWSSYPYTTLRQETIVYEEPYTIEWDPPLTERAVQDMREKARTVEASESNLYNITQTIAKTFGIFCRYEYEYDEQYHIVARTVVFFNNLIKDKNNFNKELLSFTYPYSSKSNEREIDSTDIVTKMYVRSMDDDSTALGEANIQDSEANMMMEDYILNFDYLYEVGAITEEQHDAVATYQEKIRAINQRILPLQKTIVALEEQKVELEAKITVYTNSVKLDQEQINTNSALANELIAKYSNNTEGGRYIAAHTTSNPDSAVIIPSANGGYYINLNNLKKGIQVNTIAIYRDRACTTQVNINACSFEYDEYGNPTRLYGITPDSNTNSSLVYLAYSYEPKLYYDAIVNAWKEKLYKDSQALEENKLALNNVDNYNRPVEPYGVEFLLNRAQTTYQRYLQDKKDIITKFNELMGAAIREGYWQPEDYQDRGEKYSNEKTFGAYAEANNYVNINTEKDFAVMWDQTIFDDEQNLYYTTTINETRVYYPCINISSIYSNLATLMASHDNVCVMYNNNVNTTPANASEAFANIKDIRSFAIGSEAQLAFLITPNHQVIPILILVGAKNLTNAELTRMYDNNKGYLSIAVLDTRVVNNNVTVLIYDRIAINNHSTFGYFNGYDVRFCRIVHPRIKFSSLLLKTDETNLFIQYENELLSNYEDYNIRLDNRLLRNEEEEEDEYRSEYYITLKPEVLLRNKNYKGTVRAYYTLSNASTAIYLDALEIARENAYPKVSYTVAPNVLNKSIIQTLYDKLNYLVLINDAQLKFREVFGYISKLNLDLDQPQNDQIEVKNYTNKFDDLFSSIVASTEAMQRNENLLSSLSHGTYVFPAASFTKALEKNNNEMLNYLIDNFLGSQQMDEYMSDLFTSAANVLSDSNNTLNQTQALTAENAHILSDFASTIQSSLVPTIFRQSDPPVNFKTGDLWIQVELDGSNNEQEVARWIATSDSSDSVSGEGYIYGWSKTTNGSLAALAGPGVDVDPQTGEIDLHGKNIGIIGSHSVNIGGVQVNITSDSTGANMGGINLVAANYNANNVAASKASKVLIHPDKISMFASEIEMKAGAVSDSEIGVTAMTLSGQKGIWLGSNKEIRLFSGTATLDGKLASGANIALTPGYLLFGVSNGSDAGAIKITPSKLIIATGSGDNSVSAIETTGISGLSSSLTGIQLTNNSLGIAVSSNSVVNAIIMNENGITLGSGVAGTGVTSLGQANLANATGSYVRISGKGIKLNSSATLDVNTTNVVINSTATNDSTLFRLGPSDNAALLYTPSGGLTVKGKLTASTLNVGSGNNMLTYDGSTLTVKGAITATSLTLSSGATISGMTSIAGWSIDANKLYSKSGTSYVALDSGTANQTYAIWCGNETASSAPFRVTRTGDVYLNSLQVKNSSGGYETVDFSRAFNAAVSLWGRWRSGGASGDSATCDIYAQLYTSALQCSASMTVGVNPTIITVEKGGFTNPVQYKAKATVTSVMTIDGQYTSGSVSTDTENICIATPVYNHGKEDGAAAAWDAVTVDSGAWVEGNTVYFYGRATYDGQTKTGDTDSRTISGSGSGSGTCFAKGTKITLYNGDTLPIEQLQLGMKILAYDEETETYVPSEVEILQVLKNRSKEIIDIYLTNGKIITATTSHPILTTQGWKAGNPDMAVREYHHMSFMTLQVGDKLYSPSKEDIFIEKIIRREDLDDIDVYNIDVEPYDTYLAEGIVVHNPDPGGNGGATPK